MKKLWKIFDLSLIFIVLALVLCIISAGVSFTLAAAQLVLLIGFALAKYIYHIEIKEKLLYKVKTVTDELNFEQGKAFEVLNVPCVVIEENGDIIWLNESFKNTFKITPDYTVSNFKEFIRKDNIEKLLQGNGYKIKADNMYFSVFSNEFNVDNEKFYLLYLFDETDLRLTEKEYIETRPCIMLSVLDNADEVYNNFKESDCAAIFTKIEQMIEQWVNSYGGLCRKYSSSRMMIFVEERSYQRMLSDKFAILDKVRELTYDGRSTDLTLSLGIGHESNLTECNNSAKQALDMAQSRGGDQVAIREGTQYKFFGGVTSGHEKKNKVRTRLLSKTIAEIISDSDNVLIMGHRYTDFDAIGSAMGMYCIATHLGKQANIVVNTKSTLALPLISAIIQEKGDGVFVSPDEVKDRVGSNTLVVVVDTHKQDFTDCPELIDRTQKVMVIDHHRKSVDFIEDTVMFYHMPNSSSTSEMVTEIAQYVDTKPVLDMSTALALLSGIVLDTRNFILRSGVRTFEAAAYLRSRGASTIECKKLFSNDMDIFRARNAIIDAAQIYSDCAISVVEDEIENIRLVTSQAADEMLNIEGVKASFVLYRSGKTVNVSARSYGEINVQLVMETLGGGGHQTMSASQLDITDMATGLDILKSAIDEYFSNL